jgi:hemerythrin
MPLMVWNDKFSVGVTVIDQEHQKLVGMVNELYDAVQSGHGKEVLGKILDGLITYTKTHFAHEEKFFAETDYPDRVAHKRQHDDLTRQVLDVQTKYRAGATGTLSVEVLNFLKNWLITHIQGSDKKYVPHLHAKGIR